MEKMKKFLKYILWIIAFFIFSEILINISIETTYQNIGRKDNLEQVTIYQAQATKVNGRIKGTIYNDENNKIPDRYLKIDLFSERGNYLGCKYIDLLTMREKETRELEVYFKLQDVEYYEISFVNEKAEEEIPELFEDLSRGEIILGTLLVLIFI